MLAMIPYHSKTLLRRFLREQGIAGAIAAAQREAAAAPLADTTRYNRLPAETRRLYWQVDAGRRRLLLELAPVTVPLALP